MKKAKPIFRWGIIIVLFLSTLLRFYKSSELFVFSADEEHQLSISQTIVDDFHWEWVGVSSADTGFYLGPLWMYVGAFWLWLGGGNLWWVSLAASLTGVITGLLIYFIGKTLFNQRVALISFFLYSTLPLIAYYDRKFWNPALTSTISLLLFASLALSRKNKYWWLVVGVLYGLAFHVHLSLVPLLWIILYWFWSQKKKPSWKIVLTSMFLFFLVNLPLIGFDLLHDFSNLKTPLRVAQRSGSQFHPLNNFLQMSRSLGRLWYLNPYANNADEVLHDCSPHFNNLGKHRLGITTDYSQAKWYFSVLSFGLLLWFWLKQSTWKHGETKLLALSLCSYTVFFLLLPSSPLEYYLLGFIPLFLFIPAILIDRNWRTLTGRLMLILILGISILGVRTTLTAGSDFGLQNKINLIREVSGFLDGKTFYLEGSGLCHNYEGWRFLFKVYGQLPTTSYTDSMFGWLYPGELEETLPQYRLTIQESRISVNLSEQPLKTFSSGGFSAYVFDMRQK